MSGLLQNFEGLIRIHHPDMSSGDREMVSKKLTEITTRFIRRLKKTKRDMPLTSLPAYKTFEKELKALPEWFQKNTKK